MKLETAQKLVRQAVEIRGFVPLCGEFRTYEVRELKGVDERGNWITNCPTASMNSYVRIAKRGQGQFMIRVRWIIANAETIKAERDRVFRVAMGRD